MLAVRLPRLCSESATGARTCVVDPTVLPAQVNQHVAIIRADECVPPRSLQPEWVECLWAQLTMTVVWTVEPLTVGSRDYLRTSGCH